MAAIWWAIIVLYTDLASSVRMGGRMDNEVGLSAWTMIRHMVGTFFRPSIRASTAVQSHAAVVRRSFWTEEQLRRTLECIVSSGRAQLVADTVTHDGLLCRSTPMQLYPDMWWGGFSSRRS